MPKGKKTLPPLYDPVQDTKDFFTVDDTKRIMAVAGVSVTGKDSARKLRPLTQGLEQAAQLHDGIAHMKGALRPIEARRIVEETAELASRLSELLDHLSFHPKIHQLSFSRYSWYSSITAYLPLLATEARQVLDELPESRAGRTAEAHRTNFIVGIMEAYEEAFDLEAKYHRERIENKPRGRFYIFVRECLAHIGHPEPDSALPFAIDTAKRARLARNLKPFLGWILPRRP